MFILSVFSGMALQSWSTCFLFLCLWLSSNADEKVTICEDPDTNPLTIEISSRALQAQLNQGAYVGRCPRDADEANEEVPIVCSQMDLPVCQCPGTYNWLDGEQLCGTHCMSAEEGICYLGRETYGSPVTAQCGKWECDFGHVRCRRPDFEPVRASECGDGDLSISLKKGQVGSLHRELLEINGESPSHSESPSASPSESPSPSEFSSPSPAECPYVCEDLPVCQCPEDYDYTSFGELCDTHCMEQDEYYWHPGSGNSLQPCRRLQCGPGHIRCRRPPANEPPRGPKDPRTFFLARGGESCDEVCGAAGTVCDNDLVQEAALSPAHRRDILEHLGKSVHLGGLYEDDNSGCTYYVACDCLIDCAIFVHCCNPKGHLVVFLLVPKAEVGLGCQRAQDNSIFGSEKHVFSLLPCIPSCPVSVLPPPPLRSPGHPQFGAWHKQIWCHGSYWRPVGVDLPRLRLLSGLVCRSLISGKHCCSCWTVAFWLSI